MKRAGLDYGVYERQSQRSYDPYRRFIELGYPMVLMARDALHNEAVSYRGFLVGAALLAIDEKNKRMGIYTAGNIKLSKQHSKFCAEMSVIEQAEEDEMTRAIGLVVAGTTDELLIAGVNGRQRKTLIPCRECQGVMTDSPIIHDDTMVVTMGDTTDAHEVIKAEPLLRYGIELPDQYHHADPNFDSWEERAVVYDLMKYARSRLPVADSNAGLALMATQAVFLNAA